MVVVTMPLTEETRGAIGRDELACMKESAYLVSISRGGIVDGDALLAALEQEQFAGAILDVFSEEPLPKESPFWEQPNVLVTPHISGELSGWDIAVARLFADNVERFVAGQPLRNVVDPALGY